MYIPYDEIDDGIKPLVKQLNAAGFHTTGSCEGGKGHGFRLPTVQISTGENLEWLHKRLTKWLIDQRLYHFTISTVYLHQELIKAMPESYVQLEFWLSETIRG